MKIEWQAFNTEGQEGNIGRFGEVNMLVLPQSEDRWVALVSVSFSENETQSEQRIVKGRGRAKDTAIEMAGELLVTLHRHRVVEVREAYWAGE